nr:hypothetical protein CFP56_35247 [Quercus suber]
MEDQQFGAWLRASQFNLARRSFVEVKGFEKAVEKSDLEVVAPVKSWTAKLGGNEMGMENPNNLESIDGTKSSADFAATLQEIDDEIQRFSNSKSSEIMCIEGIAKSVTEIKEIDRASEIPEQAINATEIDRELIVEGKDSDFNSLEVREMSFDMGWASKSQGKKRGPPKTHVKEKTKCIGPGSIPVTIGQKTKSGGLGLFPVTVGLDQDFCM